MEYITFEGFRLCRYKQNLAEVFGFKVIKYWNSLGSKLRITQVIDICCHTEQLQVIDKFHQQSRVHLKLSGHFAPHQNGGWIQASVAQKGFCPGIWIPRSQSPLDLSTQSHLTPQITHIARPAEGTCQ